MALAPLPHQGDLITPIDWQGETAKTTMTAGSYTLSGTIGWRPNKETATLTWWVVPAVAKEIFDVLNATHWNGAFTYQCNMRGPMKLRLTGSYSYREPGNVRNPNQRIEFSVGVETV